MRSDSNREEDCADTKDASAFALWRRTLTIAYLRFGFSASVLMAAGIAFFSLMCLAPLGVLIAAVLRTVFGASGRAYRWITEAANALGAETAGQVMPEIDSLLADPGSHLTSVFSVIVLIWASLRLFEVVERALTDVWPGKMLRTYLRRKAVALAMMLVAGLLLSSFVLLTAFLASAGAWLAHIPGAHPALIDRLRPPFLGVYQFIVAFIAFALLYKYMPIQRVPTRATLVGALFAAVLWQVASALLVQGIRHSASHGSYYGGLAGIVVFSMWCFLGAEMLLLGAHIAVAYEHVFINRSEPATDDRLISWPGRQSQDEL